MSISMSMLWLALNYGSILLMYSMGSTETINGLRGGSPLYLTIGLRRPTLVQMLKHFWNS